MPRNETTTTASPQDVWDVLVDAESYAYWVVGASKIREVEPEWPQPGSRFHHSQGIWPITLNDHSVVLDVEPPRRLVLKVKIRPLGTARVEFVLRPRAGGTHVTMIEVPGDFPSRFVFGNPLSKRLLHLRNEESLRRLRQLAEERAFKRAAAPAVA
ncbi:MAG TPA: SRPBCC domain-containing protein [Solirubrobacteraceae bacterium]|nr:SRPBCC domain-containing protein [Solirubrobacteraceae bacterium]